MRKEIGVFAIATAGHDKEKLYVIVGYEEGKYLLADGKTRTLDKHRRKQKKHLKYVPAQTDLRMLFSEGTKPVRNEDVKRAIKLQTAKVPTK